MPYSSSYTGAQLDAAIAIALASGTPQSKSVNLADLKAITSQLADDVLYLRWNVEPGDREPEMVYWDPAGGTPDDVNVIAPDSDPTGASGVWRVNGDLTAAVASLQTDVTALQGEVLTLQEGQSGGVYSFDTVADMNASLTWPSPPPPYSAAKVRNDPDPANDGDWGLNAAGDTWVQSSYDRVAQVEQSVTDLSRRPSPGVVEDAGLAFVSSQITAGTKVADRSPTGTFCGWASAINYAGENFDAISVYIETEDPSVPVRLSIRPGGDFDTIICEAFRIVPRSGQTLFVLPKRLSSSDLSGVFWVAIESAGNDQRIHIPTITKTAANADTATYNEKYQLTGSLVWDNTSPGGYSLLVRCYDSQVDAATAAQSVNDLALHAKQLSAAHKNGVIGALSIEDRISQVAEGIYTANTVYSVRNWRVQQNITAPKVINTISVPLAKNFAGGTEFTAPVLVRAALNGDWFLSHTITLEELAAYNALTTASAKSSFDYYIEFPDIELAEGDVLFIAWECGATDLMSMLYSGGVLAGVEGSEGLILYSSTAGLVAGLESPTNITSSLGFRIRVRSYYRRYINELPIVDKTDLTLQPPKKVYTVQNDAVAGTDFSARRLGLPLYIDHCVNGITEEPDFSFADSGNDFVVLFSPENQDDGLTIAHGDVETYSHTFDVVGGTAYNDSSISVEQKSTKESVGKDTMPRILCIGDSVTSGYLSNMDVPANGPNKYWACLREEFARAQIDNGDNAGEHNCLLVGHLNASAWELTYGSVTARALRAFAEGIGGWSSANHLHFSRLWSPVYVQGFWDLLGLGDGSGTDFTNSAAQQYSINTTPEGKYSPTDTAAFLAYINSQLGTSAATYADAVTALGGVQSNPDNPFYDYAVASAEGSTVAFSLATYLSRYKTLENDGTTRLLVGSTAGSEVTDAAAYDVCLPTHIIIQHGHNDGDASWIADNYRAWTDAIKAEYTANGWGTVDIGISIIDHTGTYFPSRYPDFDPVSVSLWNHSGGHTAFYNNLSRIIAEFWVDSANEDTERIFILPSGHIQPTAWATPYREIPLPGYEYTGLNSMMYKKANGGGPDYHPNGIAHRTIGLGMYAWVRYTLSL